jgi:hypothetical protein
MERLASKVLRNWKQAPPLARYGFSFRTLARYMLKIGGATRHNTTFTTQRT